MNRRPDTSALRRLLRGSRQIRDEVDEEIEFHLEMRAAELRRRGLSPADAKAEALRQFGNLEDTRDICFEADRRRARQMHRREVLAEMIQDAAHGLRQLRRRPAFTAAAVSTLAVGLGASTAVFSAADHVLLRPLPYEDADRVVTLWETDRARGETKKEVSPGNFLEWRERSASFEVIALAEPFGFDLTGDGPPLSVPAWLVSQGFFEALGVRPMLGRDFLPEEYLPDAEPVVLISHGLWQRRYGAEPSIVGRKVRVDFRPATVVGVLPPDLPYPGKRDIWAPKRFRGSEREDRTSSYMQVVARLRTGVSAEQAQAELNSVAAALAAEYPATNADTGISAVPLDEHILGPARPALLVLLGAVGFLLLIACANIGGLLLARGAERERELGVRAALGAGRTRLIRQLAVESALLAAVGGVAGVALGMFGVKGLVALSPAELPRVETIAVDGRVIVFAIALTGLSALLFGLVPALRSSRPELTGALRNGARSLGAGRRRWGLRSGLVVTEITLALVLLVGAGLLVRSFVELMEVRLGFATAERVAIQAFLWDLNPTLEQRLQRAREIEESLEGMPGVEGVALVSALPFHPHQIDAQDAMVIEGRELEDRDPRVFTTVASPDYFRLMEIPVMRGRAFTPRDRQDSPPVAIINETLARRHFPDEEPIGQQITVGVLGPPLTREIVGVVGDVRPYTLEGDPRPEVFVPFAQSGTGSVTFVAKTAGDPAALLPALRRSIWQVDPDQAIYHASTLEDLISETLVERRFNLILIAAFSLAALALAAIGIYGLISFSTGLRTQEIGLRLAMGARRGDVVSMIVRQGVQLSLPGLLLGVLGALGLTRFLGHMLYGVEPTDPLTFAPVLILMFGVAALAAYIPARRAAALDPVATLRET